MKDYPVKPVQVLLRGLTGESLAKIGRRRSNITPLQGLDLEGLSRSRGDAPGYGILPLQGRRPCRVNQNLNYDYWIYKVDFCKRLKIDRISEEVWIC